MKALNFHVVLLVLASTAGLVHADTNVATTTTAGAGAYSASGNQEQGQLLIFAPVTQSRVDRPILMPNPATPVLGQPQRFTTNGPGLAEKSDRYANDFIRLCSKRMAVDDLKSSRFQLWTSGTDFSRVLWKPFADYTQVHIPAEPTTDTIEPVVTSIRDHFGSMSPEKTHLCLGQITIMADPDSGFSNLMTSEVLIDEALASVAPKLSGFKKITPVALVDTNAYIEGVESGSEGVNITPQISGGPGGTPILAGSMFSYQRNASSLMPRYSVVIRLVLIAEAPNPAIGTKFAEYVQNELAKLTSAQTRPSTGDTTDVSNGRLKGIQATGSQQPRN